MGVGMHNIWPMLIIIGRKWAIYLITHNLIQQMAICTLKVGS